MEIARAELGRPRDPTHRDEEAAVAVTAARCRKRRSQSARPGAGDVAEHRVALDVGEPHQIPTSGSPAAIKGGAFL
jgi:hypothetical protein